MRKSVYPTAKPEDYSIPTDAIRQTIEYIRERNGLELHSFLLLRKGALLWEEYFRPHEADRLHVLHSVSKSFMATAIGLAQDQGLLSIEDKLYTFFPQHKALFDTELKKEITLRHLLMMGAGFENREWEIFFGNLNLIAGDLTEAALEVPVIHKPGEKFEYYSLGSYLLSSAFSQVCPEGIHSYLKRKLFAPMNISSSHWNVDSIGIPFGGFGMYLTAYDMTKLGQLYLQNGNWEGQQLLSKTFIQEASSKQIDNAKGDGTDENPHSAAGYGYQFWRNDFGGFRADGMKGQYIIVLPEQELVIVMTSNLEPMQIPMDVIKTQLLPHVR